MDSEWTVDQNFFRVIPGRSSILKNFKNIKSMKKLIFNLLFLLILNNLYSQYSGVYLTAGDFENDILTFKTNNDSIKIISDVAFKPEYVKVKIDKKKQFILKDSIWGAKKKKTVYRFVENNNYTLVANSGIMLYSRRINGRHMRMFYYFSENAASKLLPLTIENLDKSFTGNKKFHDLLHASKRKNEELAMYDKKLKTYWIVDIYKKSVEK
jgi:hypothetical protein